MMPETKRIVSDWLGADANKFCDQTGFLYLTDDWEPKISFNSAWGKGLHYYYISFERVFLPNRCFHFNYIDKSMTWRTAEQLGSISESKYGGYGSDKHAFHSYEEFLDNVSEYLDPFKLPVKPFFQFPMPQSERDRAIFLIAESAEDQYAERAYAPISRKLWDIPFPEFTQDQWEKACNTFTYGFSTFEDGVNLSEWLVRLQLARSKTEARTLIKGNAIKLNGVIKDQDYALTPQDGAFGKFIFVRKGKRRDGKLIVVRE